MATGLVTPTATSDDGHYFTITEFRAANDQFASETEFTDLEVEAARSWAETRFETAARCAWVERTATETHIGDGLLHIQLHNHDIRAISSVTVDGTALTATEISDLVLHPHGLVKRSSGWTEDALVSITYTYGKTSIPEPVKQAVILLAQHKVIPDNLRGNATSESTDVGFIRISHATPGGKTGLLEVDAVAADYGHAQVVVG